MSQTPIREMTQKYNRKEILTKCKTLFFGKTLSEIKSDEISEYCGYSKRTIYAYFKSKEEIFRTVRDEVIEQFFGEMQLQQYEDFSSFIDFIYSYMHINKIDFYYISLKEFKKDNEEDYFLFSKNFKPMIDVLVYKHGYAYTSLDTPLLIWNAIIYAIKNNIAPKTLTDFIIK